MPNIVATYLEGGDSPYSIIICDHCSERDGGLHLIVNGINGSPDVFITISDFDYYKIIPYTDKGIARILSELNLELEYFNKKQYHKPISFF